MVHLANDFDFDSTVDGFNYQGSVHSFDVAFCSVTEVALLRQSQTPRSKSHRLPARRITGQLIQLLTDDKVCKQAAVDAGPVSRLAALLAKQAKRTLKRLHTRKPKG